MSKLFHSIGIMTGTSMDAVDLGYIISDGRNEVTVIDGASFPFPNVLRSKIGNLVGGDLSNLKAIEDEYTNFIGLCVNTFIEDKKINLSTIDFLGFHGQTILHEPENKKTQQIGNPRLLSELTQLNVFSDFRSADIDNGGQGAPLVPIFHKAICEENPCVIVNIGGVSNITYINGEQLIGFDTGPGNALIDDFCAEHFGIPYDDNGDLASGGVIVDSIIDTWIKHPYFVKQHPKSLDRNEFAKFQNDLLNIDKIDALATLTELTSKSICLTLNQLKCSVEHIYLAGGGIKNQFMIERIEFHSNMDVLDVKKLGISSDLMESYAFAYLAIRSYLELPITFPSTTGCSTETCGGTLTEFKKLKTRSI